MTSNAWRIIFGTPIIFQILQILGLLFVVRNDFDNLEAHYRDRHANPQVYRKMVDKLYQTENKGGENNQDALDAFMEQKFEGRVEGNSGDANE